MQSLFQELELGGNPLLCLVTYDALHKIVHIVLIRANTAVGGFRFLVDAAV